MSDLVAAGEDAVSTEWIIGFVFTLVTGGNDTTTGLLGGAAELLTTVPTSAGPSSTTRPRWGRRSTSSSD